ncbi:PTS sugar transporter subunit IIA [Oceanirhabdus seepicola]|uniref:PTS glucose transporter subunit IIA n=1 Tax=Oceanirhabdus seepicola TaxID=2828781 RepID=A0A9J6P324_9CLOT|nr:PTS glucose transporter subunit IIA [Oceanirhabdus seepicola]MCM1991031.1 PTS glucose transporter subunit IIA [Oceanirhabdus seepicola]
MFWAGIVIFIILYVFYSKKKEDFKISNNDDEEVERTIEIKSFTYGKVLDITEIPDEVISSKLLGDGIGILSSGDKIYSPVDGVISTVFAYNNSLVIRCDENIDIIVHVGINTMNLEGQGFECFCKEGDRVKAGQYIIGFNPEVLEKNNIQPITYILINSIIDNMRIMKTKKENITLGESLMRIYYEMEEL